MRIDLTKSQCKNLVEFIELNLLDDIRKDTEMDNLDYLRDMLHIQDIAREAMKTTQHSWAPSHDGGTYDA